MDAPGANGAAPPLATRAEAGSTSSLGRGAALDSLRALGGAALASVLSASGGGGAAAGGGAPELETLRTHATGVWASARSWADFFNGKKFTPAAGVDELRTRLVDNLQFFASNYVIVFVALSALGVIVHPMSFVCVLAVLALYVYMFLQNPGVLRAGPLVLSQQAKRVAFGSVTALFLYLTNALNILGTWAFFSCAIALVHAGARISVKEPDFTSDV